MPALSIAVLLIPAIGRLESRSQKEYAMADLFFVGLTVLVLALSWGFIVVCDRLMESKS